MNKLKLMWLRLKFKINMNFALSDETLLTCYDRGIGKTTYLVKLCKRYNMGLVVGSQREKKRIMEEFNFKYVFTEADFKRYPHGHIHEFIADQSVSFTFLNKYYVNGANYKNRVVTGIRG